MSLDNFTVSVLTPTWNRKDYLTRVWRSLTAQTFRGFEWIVADDGSTDGTPELVRQLAHESDFPIIYIRADQHVGKICMDNAAIQHAGGEFILWCDSDDYLLPNAIARLVEIWNGIPPDMRDGFVGVSALCGTKDGVVVNPFPGRDCVDVSWNDLAERHGVKEDMLFFARADALKSHPFPEVDFVIPESVVWTAIGHRKTRLVPEALKVVEYGANNCISFSGKMEYSRGRAHALAITERNLREYPKSIALRLWRATTFFRYCTHGDIPFREALRLWGANSSLFMAGCAAVIGRLLAARDRVLGKVVKTHRAFLAAKAVTRISVEELGGS